MVFQPGIKLLSPSKLLFVLSSCVELGSIIFADTINASIVVWSAVMNASSFNFRPSNRPLSHDLGTLALFLWTPKHVSLCLEMLAVLRALRCSHRACPPYRKTLHVACTSQKKTSCICLMPCSSVNRHERSPEIKDIASETWVRFQFWPKDASSHAALNHSGRFNVKYKVQSTLWHTWNHHVGPCLLVVSTWKQNKHTSTWRVLEKHCWAEMPLCIWLLK